MLKVHRINSVEWNPSAVVALATSADGSQVAAARADGSLEIWLVSPGSVGWHCQLVRRTTLLFSYFSFILKGPLILYSEFEIFVWGFMCRRYMGTLIRECLRWCGVGRGREADRWADCYLPALMGRFQSGICSI